MPATFSEVELLNLVYEQIIHFCVVLVRFNVIMKIMNIIYTVGQKYRLNKGNRHPPFIRHINTRFIYFRWLLPLLPSE